MVSVENYYSTLRSVMPLNENTCSNRGDNSDRESKNSLDVPSNIPACQKISKRKFSSKTAGKRCHDHVEDRSVDLEDKLEDVFRHEKIDAGTVDLPVDLIENDEPPSNTELVDHSCIARARGLLSTSNSTVNFKLSSESKSTEPSDISIESMLPEHGEEMTATSMIDTQSTSRDDVRRAREAASLSSNLKPLLSSPHRYQLKENSFGEDRASSDELKRNLSCISPSVPKRQRYSLIDDQNATPKDPELKSMICIEHLSRKTFTESGLPVWEFVVHGGEDDILYYFKAFAQTSRIPNAGYGAFLSFVGAKRLNKESKARNDALMDDAVYKSRLDNFPLDAIIDEKHNGVTVHLKGAGVDRHGRQYCSRTSLKALIESNSIIDGSVFRPGIQTVRIYIAGLPSIIDRKAYFVSDPIRRIGHLGIHLESDYRWIHNAIFPAFADCIDLGRYGPFRVEDRKTDELFSLKVRTSRKMESIVQEWSLIFLLTKNFIFSAEPAQWDFEVSEKLDQSLQIIDITDDVSGKPHELAQREIPIYVNEVGYIPSLSQNIYIGEDCDRVVKYFFHSEQPLKGGDVVELLTNYRYSYEGARERKGYGWRNLSQGLKGDDCTSQRMERNFVDRRDIQNIIGLEMSLQKLSLYLDFVRRRIWIPLVELVSSHADNRTSKLSSLQWIAVLRIQWLSNIFRQRIEQDRAAPTKENLLSQLLVFNMMQTLESMPAENVDMEKPIFADIYDVDGHLVGSAIKNEVIEEICFCLHDKMPLLMDSSVYCPVGRDVIESLCMVVASSLRRKEHVNQDQKKDACNKFFRIAVEAAKRINLSAESFISDAEDSSLLFSSGIGVKSYLCCPFQTAIKLLDETSSCYLDNTTISKGFRAALIEKVSYFDGLTVAGLEPGFDSSSSKIEIEDWLCMTKFAGFPTHDDLRDLGSIPCSLSTRLQTSSCINTTWYIVWQVLWPIHMFATEYLDEHVYSLDDLAMTLTVHRTIAQFAVATGMCEQENSNHRVMQCCKPLVPFCHPKRKPRNARASLPVYATNYEKKNNQNSVKKQNVKVSSKDGPRVGPKMVYEGPVQSFPPGLIALPGWIQRSFQRQSGASAGHVDHYWYTPQTSYKLRSYVEINRFLNALYANNGNEVAAIAAIQIQALSRKAHPITEFSGTIQPTG